MADRAGAEKTTQPHNLSSLRRNRQDDEERTKHPDFSGRRRDEEEKPKEEDLPPMIAVTTTEIHPLATSWVLWYTQKSHGRPNQENYEDKIRSLGDFSSVEEFWSLYSHVLRPSKIPVATDYHLFKKGIKPMWEDDANRTGGKWMLRIRKSLTNRLWEEMLLNCIGEQFGDEICGAVVSIRFQEDVIALWNRNALDRNVRDKLCERIKKLLKLPPGTSLEYREHNVSLRDNHANYRK